MTDIAPGDIEHMRSCLPKWQSVKIVAADKIVDIDVAGIPFDGHIVITTANGTRIKQRGSWYVKHEPNVGGYFVLYKDGYASYSPAEPFEEGNVAIPVPQDEFHFINEKWFETFANAWHGRYNTIRCGAPAIDAKLFSQMKQGNIEPDTKCVWVLGTHVARYFDKASFSTGAIEQGIVAYWSPEPNEEKRAAGALGEFMGCRIFADRNAHLPTKSILLLRFKGETVTGHKLSGVTL